MFRGTLLSMIRLSLILCTSASQSWLLQNAEVVEGVLNITDMLFSFRKELMKHVVIVKICTHLYVS